MADFDTIVVGAGHNGLIAAAFLAREGLRVAVLERRANVGGAAGTIEPLMAVRIGSTWGGFVDPLFRSRRTG